MTQRFPLFPIRALAGLLALIISQPADALDMDERWRVRDYYNAVFPSGESIAMQWNGNYAARNPGGVSAAWLEATRQRVVFYRTMAGVPAEIEFESSLNALAQQAAFMMSAAGAIDHVPSPEDPRWQGYFSADGAHAAGKSNLALGRVGPSAVKGYMDDFGASNYNVGHRRWLLFPQTTLMGSGDAPGQGPSDSPPLAANALWVIPENPQDIFAPRPATRDGFVAWPPAGHVPANLVYARWSFSYPKADFSQATVNMTRDGQALSVKIEPVDNRLIGESTIVWVPNGRRTDITDPWPTPEQDIAMDVSIGNVLIDGAPQSFQYTVRIFNPAHAGAEEYPALATPGEPVLSTVPTRFTVSSRPWAEGVQARVIHADIASAVLGAENGLAGMIANTSPGYNSVQSSRVASGSAAYHLAMPDPDDQVLAIDDIYAIWPGPSSIHFKSSLAWATATQVASLEINVGDGDSWHAIWSKRGLVQTNAAFESVSVDLSEWEGLTARFRFRYYLESGSYYYETLPWAGWAIDDVSFTGTSRISAIEELDPAFGTNSFTASLEGAGTLLMQARDLAFGGFALDWGPMIEVTPAPVTGVDSDPGNWRRDRVFGWTHGTSGPWTYTTALGWIHIAAFPWIHDGTEWIRYIRGSIDSGLWVYSPQAGFSLVEAAF